MTNSRFPAVRPLALAVAGLMLASCERAPTQAGGTPAEPALARSRGASTLSPDGAFIVGNFSALGAPGDGVLRYTARGDFVDQFVPTDPDRLIVGCCMTYGPDDNLYVVSPFFDTVLRYNGATGEFMDVFVSSAGGLVFPVTIRFGPDGHLYVAEFGADFSRPSMRRFNGRTGEFMDVFIQPHAGGMAGAPDPQSFRWGPDGHLYLTAPVAGKLLRFDGRTGVLIDAFVENGDGRPVVGNGLAFGDDGLLYLNDGIDAVARYDARTGEFVDVFVPPGSGGLSSPEAMVFGPDGHLYVASSGRGNVLRYHGTTGAFIDEFIPSGRGGINGPRMIEFKMKMKVCHRPAGNGDASTTISVGQLDAADHVAHVDVVGACA